MISFVGSQESKVTDKSIKSTIYWVWLWNIVYLKLKFSLCDTNDLVNSLILSENKRNNNLCKCARIREYDIQIKY